MRGLAGRLLASLLVLWTVGACALELRRSHWLHANDPWTAEQPSTWRRTSAHIEQLEAFTTELRPHLEVGDRVAVTSAPGTPHERFFRFMWLSYLLPEQQLRMVDPEAGPEADVDRWLAYGTRLDPERFEPFAELGPGALYRLRGGR